MKLSKFTYDFNDKLIARFPKENKEDVRLLVMHKDTGIIEHKMYKDLLEYFDTGDVFVINNSKVIPSKLFGLKEKSGAEVEVFLLRELDATNKLWDVIVEPARKIRIGNKLYFGENEELVAEVIDNTTSRGRTIRFLTDLDYEDFKKLLFSFGSMPIPTWVRDKAEASDDIDFQTMFADIEGSVVLPSALRPFDRYLHKRAEIKGVHIAPITYHLGLGTYRKIEVEDLSKSRIDSERYIISEATEKIINNAKNDRKKICSIGISTLKAIESASTTLNMVKATDAWTTKFFFVNSQFNIANSLVTGLHQPLSPMLIMSASFGGYDYVMSAYEEAVKNGYEFGPYGDAILMI